MDIDDTDVFFPAINGPGVLASNSRSDIDKDGDADMADVQIFQQQVNG